MKSIDKEIKRKTSSENPKKSGMKVEIVDNNVCHRFCKRFWKSAMFCLIEIDRPVVLLSNCYNLDFRLISKGKRKTRNEGKGKET